MNNVNVMQQIQWRQRDSFLFILAVKSKVNAKVQKGFLKTLKVNMKCPNVEQLSTMGFVAVVLI